MGRARRGIASYCPGLVRLISSWIKEMNKSEKLMCQNPLDLNKAEPLRQQGCEEALAIPALLPWRSPRHAGVSAPRFSGTSGAPSFITEEALQRSSQWLAFTPCGKRSLQLVFSFEQGALFPGH